MEKKKQIGEGKGVGAVEYYFTPSVPRLPFQDSGSFDSLHTG